MVCDLQAIGNVRKRPFDAFHHNIETITNLKAKCHETSTDNTSHKILRNNNVSIVKRKIICFHLNSYYKLLLPVNNMLNYTN